MALSHKLPDETAVNEAIKAIADREPLIAGMLETLYLAAVERGELLAKYELAVTLGNQQLQACRKNRKALLVISRDMIGELVETMEAAIERIELPTPVEPEPKVPPPIVINPEPAATRASATAETEGGEHAG